MPFPGWVNFVPAVASHSCLNLPATFSQPGNGILAELCIHTHKIRQKALKRKRWRTMMERGAASHCTRITHRKEEEGEGFTPTYTMWPRFSVVVSVLP